MQFSLKRKKTRNFRTQKNIIHPIFKVTGLPTCNQVDIPIYVLEGDSVLVTFEGCGFDKRDSVPLQLHDGHLAVPCTQKVPLPGQVGDGETSRIVKLSHKQLQHTW